MEQTILQEILSFIGTSIAGGITWDVLKKSGADLISLFKSLFTNRGFFKNEKDAEKFLNKIADNEPYNENPLEDAYSIYRKCSGKEITEEFKEDFDLWIKENAENFKNISSKSHTIVNGIYIGKQEAKDSAHIINIGQLNRG